LFRTPSILQRKGEAIVWIPSPLNGERAGVRGEKKPSAFGKAVCAYFNGGFESGTGGGTRSGVAGGLGSDFSSFLGSSFFSASRSFRSLSRASTVHFETM